MDQLHAGFCKIREVSDLLWIAFSDKDDEWRFVHNSFFRLRSPIVLNRSAVDQAIGVAFDRKYSYIGRGALQDLVCYRLRPRERSDKAYIGTVLAFPLGRELLEDLFFKRLLHYREAVDGYRLPASVAAGTRPGKTASDSEPGEGQYESDVPSESIHNKVNEAAKHKLRNLFVGSDACPSSLSPARLAVGLEAKKSSSVYQIRPCLH